MPDRLNSFESAILRALGKRISEMLEARGAAVLSGGAMGEDAATTAQNYAQEMGYGRALRDVAEWCVEIEQNLLRGKS